MEILHDTGTLGTTDGLTLFEQWWRPSSEPRAALGIVHGLGEHSTRYYYVARTLADYGFAVHTFDLRGHGQSEGRRVYVRNFAQYLDDLSGFLDQMRKRVPDNNIFLLGHSMGGAIVTLYAILHQPRLNGVILSGAALKLPADLSPALVKLSGIIGKLMPKLPTKRLESRWISRDPAVVQVYNSDPLIYRRGIPARTGAEIIRATDHIQASLGEFRLPVLVLHGAADRLTDPQGSRMLFQLCRSADKKLRIYDDLYHEILNEPEKERILKDVFEWLDARCD